MAVVAFDPLEYAQQLEAAGMPRAQAEVVAKGLTTMFIHNFDALVTKDYLDTRFSEFESKMDLRFAEHQSGVDLRFAELESKMDVGFARVNIILGILLVAIAIPMLQTLLTWFS
jgi:hypothetical protein